MKYLLDSCFCLRISFLTDASLAETNTTEVEYLAAL